MVRRKKELPKWKIILFALIPLLLLIVVGEVGLRVVYFQKIATEPFALQTAYEYLSNQALRYRAAQHLVGVDLGALQKEMYASKDPAIGAIEHKYREGFSSFSEAVHAHGADLLILYLPSDDFSEPYKAERSRAFFSGLAQDYGASFVDMSDDFNAYDPNTIFLLPANGHPSRFANILITNALETFILEHPLGVGDTYSERPSQLGGLKPGDSRIWVIDENMPYYVHSNSQGFRMEYDLEFPKEHKRVLVMGDSFAFGAYLPTHDSFPSLLDNRFEDIQVINAGIPSTSIPDQLALFKESAMFAEPDLVVLQVTSLDIFDLFYLKRAKTGTHIDEDQLIPAPEEKAFVERMSAQSS